MINNTLSNVSLANVLPGLKPKSPVTSPAQTALNNKIQINPTAFNPSGGISLPSTSLGGSSTPSYYAGPVSTFDTTNGFSTHTQSPYSPSSSTPIGSSSVKTGGQPVTNPPSTPTPGLIPVPPPQFTASSSVNGNVQTPSGAIVNAGTGGLVSAPQNSTPSSAPSYPGLVSGLASFNPLANPQVSDAYKKAQDINQQIADSSKNEANAVATNRLNPIPIGDQTGREAVIQNQYLAQQNALASELEGQTNLFQGGLTGTGQQVTAQTNAAGLAAPQLAGFNQQSFNPLTGQFGASGSGTSALSQLPAQAQSAIQSYAQQIQNGAMTRADAESRLSAYGVAGTNALNEVLGTGFNTNASNASAGTTATGQQIQTAASATNSALDTLSVLFTSLNPLQTSGIPLSNSIANWIGEKFGQSALSQYKTNLADARSQLIGVLNSAGGTPTGNEATALQYLPDNMTKSQFDANVGTAQNPGIVRQLVAQKVASFTQSGQQNATTNSNNIYSW